MSGQSPAAAGVPGPHESILFQALRAFPAGAWVELGDITASSTPGTEFERAGWHAIRPDIDAAGSLSDPLACVGDTPVYWMAVHDIALESLASWRPGVCHPLVVLVRTERLAPAGLPQPAWQDALVRNGYVFTAADEDYACFVRNDQPTLQSCLAQLATQRWRTRLQASRQAHVQGQREAEQARNAARRTQAEAVAAQAAAQALQRQLAALHASTSWKSTKPLRWLSRLRRQPRLALRQLGALATQPLRKALLDRVESLLRPDAAPVGTEAPADPPAIHPNNMVGPQFKKLLLDELDRGVQPSLRQGSSIAPDL